MLNWHATEKGSLLLKLKALLLHNVLFNKKTRVKVCPGENIF